MLTIVHDMLNKLIIIIISLPSANTHFILALGLDADCILWIVKYCYDGHRLEGAWIYEG